LAQAQQWGLVAPNAAALVDATRIPRKQIAPLDPENARKLLEAAKGSRFEAVYITALTVGLRRGEVLGLLWSDIDSTVECSE
jgi:integrase